MPQDMIRDHKSRHGLNHGNSPWQHARIVTTTIRFECNLAPGSVNSILGDKNGGNRLKRYIKCYKFAV